MNSGNFLEFPWKVQEIFPGKFSGLEALSFTAGWENFRQTLAEIRRKTLICALSEKVEVEKKVQWYKRGEGVWGLWLMPLGIRNYKYDFRTVPY